MKFIKKISVSFFLIILAVFLFSNIVFAETATTTLLEPHILTPAELAELNNMPSVQTYDFKLDKAVYEAGDTVRGTFFIKNNRSYNLPDLKYTVSLAGTYDKRTGLPAMIYDSKPFGPVFLAGSEVGKEVSFSYALPVSYAGDDFGIEIKTFTNAGLPLGWNDSLIKINGISKALKIDSAFVEVDGKKFGLQDGPSIRDGKEAEVHIVVSNPLKENAVVSGKINIYSRTITGKLLGTYNTALIEIKPGKTQEIVLDLNKYISDPGVYEGSFVLLDEEGVAVSQEIKFRYIMFGNIVTIQRVVADKELVAKGEVVNINISYTGSPFDITNGEMSSQKPMNTKIVLSDLEDNAIANYEGLIDYNNGTSISIPLTALQNADYIKIGLAVYDDAGKIVASYNSVLSDTTKERPSNNNWIMIIAVIIIVLFLAVFLFCRVFKKKSVLLFLVLFFAFGICQSTNAAIPITWTSGTATIQNYISAQLYNSTKGTYDVATLSPGDQFTISGTVTTPSCSNPQQVNNVISKYSNIDGPSASINGAASYSKAGAVEYYYFTFPAAGSFSTATVGSHTIKVSFTVYLNGVFQGIQNGYISFTIANPNHTITFNKNDVDATGTMGTQSIAQGSSANLNANAFSKTNYSFAGWATTAGGAVAYANGASYTMGSADVTLYAKWTANPTYTVTFDSQGGSTVSPISGITSGSTITLPSNPTRSGYIFSGWWTGTNGTGTQFTGSTPVTANITIYAKWTVSLPSSYNLNYALNGGSGGPSPNPESHTAGTITLSSAVPTKSGYGFEGWLYIVYPLYGAGNNFEMPSNAVTLTAQWIANPVYYTVTYSGNGNTDGSAPIDGNNYISGATVTVLDKNTLVKTDYTFAGWTVYSDGSGTVYNPGVSVSMPSNNVVLYAKWSSNTTFVPTCVATQGGNATTSIIVNSPMSWRISGIPNGNASIQYTTYNGETTQYFSGTISGGMKEISKIYTTIGVKAFDASITSDEETQTCSATTTVIQSGGGSHEF